MHASNEKNFLHFLKEHFSALKTAPKPVQLDFDTTADIAEINAHAMKWHDFIGPYGMGFHVPLLQIHSVKVSSVKELKGGHLKLSLSGGEQATSRIDALLFSPTPKLKEITKAGSQYHILAELQWNYFNGQKTIQLLVKDLKLA